MDITTNNGLDGLIDITPKNSHVPIYFLENQLTEESEWETPDQMIAAHNAVKQSAVDKLKKIGLTEEEAKAIVGV